MRWPNLILMPAPPRLVELMGGSGYLIMLPGPTNVPDRVLRAMCRPIIGHRGPEFRELYARIVENARYAFQTEGDVLVLTCSGTGGVACALENLLQPGDKVVVPVFGVFSERMAETARRRGAEVIEVPVEWGSAPTVEQVEPYLRDGVKALCLVYNETSTGATARELPKLAELAKDHGALVVVDAVSILAGDKLPVDEWGIDICVTGSQKCLACPPGLALISVSEEAWKAIEANPSRPFYFDLVRAREFYRERCETPFTPAIPLFYALDEALAMLREEGLEKRIERHARCARAFYAAVEALGLEPFPEPRWRSQTVIAIRLPEGVRQAELRAMMKDRYGVLIAGGMGKIRELVVRIGCMGVISAREVLITVSALESCLSDLGHRVQHGAGVRAAKRELGLS